MEHKYTQATIHAKQINYTIVIILCLFTVFSIKNVYSQSKKEEKILKNIKKDTKELKKINTTYISILPKDKILLGFHGGGINDRFVLQNKINDSKYQLNSNIVPSAGLDFKYKRLPTISFSLPINIFSENSPFITKGYSLGMHFQASRLLLLDVYYFQISGLKLKKIDKTNIAPPTENHGSKTFNITMEMFVLFNNAKYSYKNSFLSGEIQKKSAGTIVLGMSYSYFNQKNKDPLFDVVLNLNPELNFKQNLGFSFAPMLGYLHTFVIGKKFYLGGGLLYGPNIHFGKSKYFTKNNKLYLNVSSSVKAKFTTGYNSDHFLIKLIGHSGFYGFKPRKKLVFNNYLTDFRMSVTYIL